MKNNKKTLVILLLVIILLVIAGYVGFNYKSFFAKHDKEQQVAEKEFKVEDKKITDETKPFSINVIYPYINGHEDFNILVENTVNKEISGFKEFSLDNDAAVKEIDPKSYEKYPRSYYLSIAYDKGQIDENIISIVLNIESYTGGAHGAHYPISINYNVKDKKEVKLADLFKNQNDYLKKISDYCINSLTKQVTERVGAENKDFIDYNAIKTGASPDEKNFSTFLIKNNTIVFYFPEYQVAAYAVGSFTVEMPK